MNKSYASAAALCLIYNVQAVKVTESREPLLTWSPTGHKAGFKMGYTVPNFGPQSTEIADTYQSLATTEEILGHKMGNPAAPSPKGPPKDYFVPNFGKDSDIASTQVSAIAAEDKLGHTWDWKKDTSKPPPRDYFIPNFGEDREISFTRQHLAQTEEKLGHKWNWSKAGGDPKRDYFVPNFGLDSDVKDSLSHLKQEQAIHGTWDLPKDDWFIQTEEGQEREPLLTWSPTAHKAGHPVDYFVPNFGPKDEDISTTQKNIASLEVKFPSFVQTDSEIEREPLLTWEPTAHKSFKKDYFVPNFGPQDVDIANTYGHLSAAEDKLGHKWNWSKAGPGFKKDYFVPNFGDRSNDVAETIKSVAQAEEQRNHKWIPSDPEKIKQNYFVPNFGNDENMATLNKNLEEAEAKVGHKWVLEKDEDDKFIVPSAEIDFKL